MIKLENDDIVISINEMGAELKSIFSKKNQIEYIWPGEKGSFKKSAPNLFPFIGNIKYEEIDYPYNGERKILPMTKHGFARDLEFQIVEKSATKVVFQLEPNNYTKERYPYKFSLKIIYEIVENQIIHKYLVKNNDLNKMYYEIGGHTAFNCNYNNDLNIENYYLEFDNEEVKQYVIDSENNSFLSEKYSKVNIDKFYLSKEKFKKDAFVFECIKLSKVKLKHLNTKHGVDFQYENLPILTLWTNLDSSEFICLEPWAGMTDFTNNSRKVEEKNYIETLNFNEEKEYIQKIKVY